jgi:hypothetical protein
VVVLELVRRRGHAAFALLIAVVGFGASLAVLNVDGFIVNRNVTRAAAGEELDVEYLNALSSDAVPQLLANYTNPALPENVREKLGAALACRVKVTNDPASLPWQEFNVSQARAFKLLTGNSELFRDYQPVERANEWFILVDGEEIPCSTYVGFD